MTNCCNRCGKETCGCPREFLSITHKPENFTTWLFSQGGLTSEVDFRPLVFYGQTDTSLSVEQAKRLLKFQAERHIDSLTAEELGSILRLSDIGDVDGDSINDNSMLFYTKAGCGADCEGVDNHWYGWDALSNIAEQSAEGATVSPIYYPMGFTAGNTPQALNTPNRQDRTHVLGWVPDKGVAYLDIQEGTATAGRTGTLHIDLTTKELLYVAD